MIEPEYQKKLYRKIAMKHGLSYTEARKACLSQFVMTAKAMRSGTFEDILLNGFIKVSVNLKRLSILTDKELAKLKDEII